MALTAEEHATLQDALADLCERAKTYVKHSAHYRATILLRDTRPDKDGTVLVTEDDAATIIAAVRGKAAPTGEPQP